MSLFIEEKSKRFTRNFVPHSLPSIVPDIFPLISSSLSVFIVRNSTFLCFEVLGFGRFGFIVSSRVLFFLKVSSIIFM